MLFGNEILHGGEQFTGMCVEARIEVATVEREITSRRGDTTERSLDGPPIKNGDWRNGNASDFDSDMCRFNSYILSLRYHV